MTQGFTPDVGRPTMRSGDPDRSRVEARKQQLVGHETRRTKTRIRPSVDLERHLVPTSAAARGAVRSLTKPMDARMRSPTTGTSTASPLTSYSLMTMICARRPRTSATVLPEDGRAPRHADGWPTPSARPASPASAGAHGPRQAPSQPDHRTPSPPPATRPPRPPTRHESADRQVSMALVSAIV